MPIPIRVLIVEDSLDDAELLLLELSRGGFEALWKRVDTADGMRTALAESQWDIVLSDNSVAGFGARAALAVCRECNSEISFIVVSNTIGEEHAVEMMRAGANDYLLKNDLARLVYVIKRELRESQSRHDRRKSSQEIARLAAIVESSVDAILSETLDGLITTWNSGAEALFGWTEEEVIGRHVSFFVPPEETDELAAIMQNLRQGNGFGRYETARLHRDGSQRKVIVTLSQIRDPNGEIVGFSKILRDITAQKEAEKSLSLLAAIVESSEDAIISVDRDDRVQTWNHAAEQLFGFTPAEAIGLSEFLIPRHLIADIRDKNQRLWNGEHFPPFETIRLRKGGDSVEVSISMSAVRVDGTIVAKSVIFRDLSHRNRVDRENLMLRSIIDYSPQFIAVSHQNKRMVFVNRAGQTLLGLVGDEEVGRISVADLHSVEEMDRIGREIIPILVEGGSVRSEIAFRHFQSEIQIPAEAILFALPNLDGKPAFFACIAHDITTRKLAEKQLTESEAKLRHQADILQTVLDNMSDGVVVSNERGEFILFNPAAERILHLGMTDTGPSQWQEVYGLYLPDGQTPYPTAELPLVKALRGEHCEEVLMIVKHDKPTEARWISVNASPMYAETSKLQGGIAVIRNITDTKLAELALQESETRFRTLVTATSAIVWNSPPSGAFDTPQPAWTAFTGQTIDKHKDLGWLDAIHPDDREKSARAWAAAIAERGVYNVEHRLRRRDGEYRQMLVRAVPILDSGNSIREWVGVHTDVTEQKNAEEATRASESRFRAFMDNTPAAADIKDLDGRLLYVNSAWLRQFKIQPTSWLGKTNYDFWPSNTADIFRDSDERCLSANTTLEIEETALTSEGEERTLMVMKFPLFDGGKRCIGGMAWNISDRKRIEKALQLSQHRLQHVLSSSPSVLFTMNIAGNKFVGIDWISENVKSLFGYTPEESLGQRWWMSNVHPEERELVASRAQQQLSSPGRSTQEYRFRHASGHYIWTRSEVLVIRDANGVATEAVGSWSDITERRSLEDQFHQAQKMDAFGQLAAGVAHDFNNLLTIINGYSDMLLRELPQGDSRDLVKEIYLAGERSAGLTRQLLAFSRQQILAPKILDLNEVVTESNKMLRRIIGEDILLTTTLATQLWNVRADPGQIEQVLLNLAVNSRDAMPTGGRLTIETQNVELNESYVRTHQNARVGSYVMLSVTDTGCGMSPKVKSRIFEPFFTTKELGKGTGLGLATVFGIVNQSDGHIEVYTEVGVGTTFKVYLPRFKKEAEGARPKSRIVTPPRGTETILLAEDEGAVRSLASRVLIGCGYKVLEAADGYEAIQTGLGHNEPISLLITDVVMPGSGGRNVAEQLAVRHPEVRVLYMSGYTDDAIIRHGVLREGANFIQKPFLPLALAIKVREILDQPAAGTGVGRA